MSRKKNVHIRIHIINEVLLFISDEQILLRNRLGFPKQFVQSKSPKLLDWIPRGKRINVITKIIELCIALCSIEELYDLNGKQATFLDIVSAISAIFGVVIKQPHKIKSQVLSRNNTSPLLRLMSDSFEQEVKMTTKRKG